MREAEMLSEPTPEEIAEADRILNEALAPYVEQDIYLRERELRKEVLTEHVSPYLFDLSKPTPPIKPIIERAGATIASLGNISAVVYRVYLANLLFLTIYPFYPFYPFNGGG